MTDQLKFIKDVESRSIGLSETRGRRSFDAFDELRTQNSRLQRELAELKEENRQLKEKLGQSVIVAPVAPKPLLIVPIDSKEELDDAETRFSLLELK